VLCLVRADGGLPSALTRPTGSLVAGTPAHEKTRQMMSLMLKLLFSFSSRYYMLQ
jgi:hypothetical protein